VKDYLRISGTDFDTTLTLITSAATTYGEKITGRDFINKAYKTYLDRFPVGDTSIEIKKSKLQSITSIQYFKDDVLTTFDAANYYITDSATYATVNVDCDENWPTDADCRRQTVVIEFIAGYSTLAADVPDLIKRALLAHIASLFENLGDCSDCQGSEASPQALSLYNPCIIAPKLFSVIC